MDFGIIDVAHPLDPSLGVPPFEAYTPARYAMGDTRRYAERMGLIDMTPQGELSSTGFALANVGAEYLVLQPSEKPEPFSVQLPAGEYAVEWFGVASRETTNGGVATVERDGRQTFRPPFDAGPAVLYLKRMGR
jgi:hypothetical protein